MRTRRRSMLAVAAVLAILPATTAAIEVRRVTLPTRRLVADPVRQKLYASVPGTSLSYGNHVVRIDPETGRVDAAVFVGSEPGALAIDAAATVLYVGIDGTGRVVRVNLDSFAVEQDFPLGS